MTPGNLFDRQLGDNNVHHWHSDRSKLGATLIAINVTDKYELYDLLSTFWARTSLQLDGGSCVVFLG